MVPADSKTLAPASHEGTTECLLAQARAPGTPILTRLGLVGTAMSAKMLATPLHVVGLGHEQPVPIFQQLAGGHPPSCPKNRA